MSKEQDRECTVTEEDLTVPHNDTTMVSFIRASITRAEENNISV